MRTLFIEKSITRKDSDRLNHYLSSLAKENPLSAEEECELIVRIRKGDDSARQKLIKRNLKFVVSVAKQYQHQGMDLSDLINEGNIGLCESIDRFDETKGFKFISYAVWWIRQSIMAALAENSKSIRLPMSKIIVIRKMNKIIDALYQLYGREVSTTEISKYISLSEKELDSLMLVVSNPSSIDVNINEDDETCSLKDLIADNTTTNILNENDRKVALKRDLLRVMNILPKRDKEILCSLFGINSAYSKTMEEVSEEFGLSLEMIRKIKFKCLDRIKKSSGYDLLKQY